MIYADYEDLTLARRRERSLRGEGKHGAVLSLVRGLMVVKTSSGILMLMMSLKSD